MTDMKKFYNHTKEFKRSIEKNKFISKANEKYNQTYDYSNVNYINAHIPISILCKKHNKIFMSSPANHLRHSGCSDCFKDIMAYGKEKFLEEAKKIHNNKYDYSLINYVSNNRYVNILCSKHGLFKQKPSNHLKGQGCYLCYLDKHRKHINTNITTNINLINKNIEKLKNKFPDFEFKDYIHFDKPIKVICKLHGTFYKTPHSLLRSDGVACKICNRNSSKYRDAFIEKAKAKHSNKFDYSKLDMNDKKPIFICKQHGEFRQEKKSHLAYEICCPKCISEKISISKEDFLKKAQEKFNGKYDYSKMNYVNINTPIEIICPKHGPFKKLPSEHIRFRKKRPGIYGGCPICFNRSIYEIKAYEYLNKLGIKYITQFKLDNYDFRWDICIPDINLLIEIDDKSHLLKKNKEIDRIKSIIANSFKYNIVRIRVITSNEKAMFINNLIKYLKSFIRYKVDSKLFTNFLDLAKYLKLYPEERPEQYKKYEFNIQP